ncbi:MAG TPA: type 4a pilus biogenesis protein PilO [Nitriliruptorales bacterium]
MNRTVALLTGLVVVALLLAWWFLLYSPKGEEIAEVEQQIEDVQIQQVQAQNRINELEDVRQRAPEIEAQINAADAIIPSDPALPAALRQLQMAADAAGVDLPTIAIARPGEGEGANAMSVSLSISGGYFQIIDFLRRIEDPTITPRGILWTTVSVGASEYPTLTAALSGTMFARNVPPPVADLDEVDVVVDDDAEEAA